MKTADRQTAPDVKDLQDELLKIRDLADELNMPVVAALLSSIIEVLPITE